jgi:hypothetical protein
MSWKVWLFEYGGALRRQSQVAVSFHQSYADERREHDERWRGSKPKTSSGARGPDGGVVIQPALVRFSVTPS